MIKKNDKNNMTTDIVGFFHFFYSGLGIHMGQKPPKTALNFISMEIATKAEV
jgi:hypothetical protein